MTPELLETGCIQSWSEAAAPPPLLTVSEWADEKRLLPETSSGRGAHWNTASAPYLRGIMDGVHEPGVGVMVLKKAAQVGGSEALHNILGYHIEHDPCAMLFVHPSDGVAEEWSKERLADLIRSTPALRAVVRTKRQPRELEAESTLRLKVFAGGYLAIGGANTENTFARRAARIVYGDDIDRFPPVVGEEGDPIELLINRTTTFHDGLAILVSTPTLKGGRIDTWYQRSDQRKYFVPCLSCGRTDYITWSNPNHFHVTYTDRDPQTARLACPDPDHGGCGAALTEPDRRLMLAEGEWQPTADSQQSGLIGFDLPAMLSTLGNVTLASLTEKWLAARTKGKESLRVFVNTTLAEGWEDKGARIESNSLRSRRELYGVAALDGAAIEVPAAAVALTAGVDVQDNRFELQVWGWGPGEERWVVDWRTIPGDPKRADTRTALLEALQRKYLHALGLQLPILSVCIDSGYATDEVYDFVLAHQHRKFFATKGYAGRTGEPIVGKPSKKRESRPIPLYPINVDDGKGEVLNSLTLAAPGPGYLHFPLHLDTIDDEYFAQLCAEHKETRYNKGGVATHTVWVLDRDRNEALDTAVLAIASYRLLRPNLRQYAEQLAAAAATVKTIEPSGSDGSPAPTPPLANRRRHAHSEYLR